ncbi:MULTISPECIES: glycosyltransferase family 2 protein [Sphingobium]|uniref:Glycosyltransferase 2-like domain-containing protein n=1 Tax=Sphingobium lignivorans TaxID=2735886 RepID=A0ABR6NCN4_9SPHN|nr:MULTISPECIES: glycosyltransferase family 2 protein [Sphingobium]MBB5985025.1 hypothetical protein [Sphingobium lignivorans]BAK65695.1 putative glycosyltransferase [Sphingobium sp. SYK-6]
MTEKSLSIVTVALNAAADLPLTIESVLHQSYANVEYIFVDGMSWDATSTILDRYAGAFDRVEHIEDGSIYDAMNAAAFMASNDYILFLNAGDRLYSADTVADMFARVAGDPDIFYGDHVYVNGRLEKIQRSSDFSALRDDLRRGTIDRRWHSRIPGHQATFTRASLLRDIRYNPRYSICADHDFLFRAYDEGARMQYIDEIVAHYLAGGFSGAQGSRIQREWAHAYRSRSLRPTQVDKFMFGSATASPFEMHTPYCGYYASGSHAPDMPDPASGFDTRVRWAGITEMVTPSDFASLGITIVGDNTHPDQKLTLMSGGRVIAEADIGLGQFHLDLRFSQALPPGSRLTIIPEVLAPLTREDSRVAGIRLADFHFEIMPPSRSTDVAAREDQLDEFSGLLSNGWSGVEVSGGFVWSVAHDALLMASFAACPETMSLYCSANPFVEGGQKVTIYLNERPVGHYELEPSTGPQPLTFAPAGKWRRGSNTLRLSVDKLAQPPGDDRRLGIAFSRLTWA